MGWRASRELLIQVPKGIPSMRRHAGQALSPDIAPLRGFCCTLTSPLSHQSCVVIDLYGTSFRSASLPFVDSIAGRSRELLASRRGLQKLTSCWYSPSLAAVGLCRKSTYVFGSSGRRSASATKAHVGVRQAHGGAWEVLPGKKFFIRWPAGEPSLAIG